jgi:glycosyltransferase involved in cell wall biosynthesis
LKICIHSNAPWAGTGYGVQTALFAPRLKALGHEVWISAYYGLAGGILRMGDVPVLGGSKDPYGNDMLLAHREYYQFDVVIGLMDVWVLSEDMITALNNYVAWLPIDHDPCPPSVLPGALASVRAISYSQFGRDKLAEAGVKQAAYIPLGVDTGAMQIMDRGEARRKIGLPEEPFIAAIVCANKGAPSRKSFDQQIRAFAAFHQRHPDSVLYLHTDLQGVYGENLHQIIELSGVPKTAVSFVNQYQYCNGMLGADHMNYLFNAPDVVMNATMAEGFGVPIVEAQACGTPVITTDFSSMPEITFEGWRVPYVEKLFTPQGAHQVIPSTVGITEALEQAYAVRGDADMRARARDAVMQFDATRIAREFWEPMLAELQDELDARNDTRQREIVSDRRKRRKAKREALREVANADLAA